MNRSDSAFHSRFDPLDRRLARISPETEPGICIICRAGLDNPVPVVAFDCDLPIGAMNPGICEPCARNLLGPFQAKGLDESDDINQADR